MLKQSNLERNTKNKMIEDGYECKSDWSKLRLSFSLCLVVYWPLWLEVITRTFQLQRCSANNSWEQRTSLLNILQQHQTVVTFSMAFIRFWLKFYNGHQREFVVKINIHILKCSTKCDIFSKKNYGTQLFLFARGSDFHWNISRYLIKYSRWNNKRFQYFFIYVIKN